MLSKTFEIIFITVMTGLMVLCIYLIAVCVIAESDEIRLWITGKVKKLMENRKKK